MTYSQPACSQPPPCELGYERDDDLAVGDGVGDDAGAGLDARLLGERALGRAEPLALAVEAEVRLGDA